MELNLIATGIELLGASVAKLTVDNTIVDIENDAQRSFGMTINEPQFQNIEKTREIFSQMTIDFDIIINQSDNDNCNIHFTITGAFLSKGKISEERLQTVSCYKWSICTYWHSSRQNRISFFVNF